jgi:hypothetical protein
MNVADEFKTFQPASDETIDEVLLPDQQFCVFQLAHAQTAIRSPDGHAWIRCIGFTRTLDAARVLARNAHDMGDKAETRIMPVGRVFLAGRTKYEGLDLPRREEEQIKANKLIDTWIALREKVHEDTQRAAAEKRILEPSNAAAEAEPSSNAAAGADRPGTPMPPTLDVLPPLKDDTVRVDRQGAWALGIIPDVTGDKEPAILALFAADTVQDTQVLVKRAARCKDLVHVDIFVGATAEWLPLESPLVSQTFHHHPLRQATESQIRWVHE